MFFSQHFETFDYTMKKEDFFYLFPAINFKSFKKRLNQTIILRMTLFRFKLIIIVKYGSKKKKWKVSWNLKISINRNY
jgi:hypothetical protein